MKSKDSRMFRTEWEFLRWLGGLAKLNDRCVRLGIGDDAALVHIGESRELVLTTDLSIEGVHFTGRIHSARSVGHRALARALSDIAAMGATPRFALVSLAITKHTTRRWLEEFYAGMESLARRFGVSLVGGDTAVVPRSVSVDAIAVGEIARGKAMRRSGAGPGDLIYVSGRLGMSALGLGMLKSRRPPGSSIAAGRQLSSEAIQAHLFPEPRCGLGRYLAERRLASAMMDISDGLSSDLARLCEASAVGARIEAALIPAPEIHSRGKSLALALNGGEDYELLFTVSPSKASRLPGRFQGLPIHRLGEIRRNRKLILIDENGKENVLRPSGFDHFRKE
jgi:thiamine-monophosphate kinase